MFLCLVNVNSYGHSVPDFLRYLLSNFLHEGLNKRSKGLFPVILGLRPTVRFPSMLWNRQSTVAQPEGGGGEGGWEGHTSEPRPHGELVSRLLFEKKKKRRSKFVV